MVTGCAECGSTRVACAKDVSDHPGVIRCADCGRTSFGKQVAAWSPSAARERLREYLCAYVRDGEFPEEQARIRSALLLAGSPGDPCAARETFVVWCAEVLGHVPS